MAKRKTQTFSRWLVQSGDRVWEGTDLADMQRAIEEAFPVNGGSMDIEVGPKRLTEPESLSAGRCEDCRAPETPAQETCGDRCALCGCERMETEREQHMTLCWDCRRAAGRPGRETT